MSLKWMVILYSLVVIGCSEQVEENTSTTPKKVISPIDIPTNSIDKSKLEYKNKISLWTLNGSPYSGYVTSIYPDGTLKQQFGVFNGKKQNQTKYWYTNGQLKRLANYHQGKLHGEKKSWTNDSTPILISHLNYHLGKLHGVQKQWYNTGETYKILHLNMGKEEGLQQAFRKNGVLYANYEAREGRVFGLKKAALCYGLESEKIQNEK